MIGRSRLGWSALCAGLMLASCTPVPPPGDPGVIGDQPSDGFVPAGFGTLIQDEITLTLFYEELRIKVTPLSESIIRLAAPDTYDRLHNLAGRGRNVLEDRTGTPGVSLFLVSFFTRSQNASFEPADVQLVNRGVRFRNLGWEAIGPGFGAQRLTQEVPQSAVYAFAPEIDLEVDLALEYQGVTNAGWASVLSRVREERSRVRARARGGL